MFLMMKDICKYNMDPYTGGPLRVSEFCSEFYRQSDLSVF